MKLLLIGFLSLLCLASCKKQNNFDPTFIVVTKHPINVGLDSAHARGAIISLDQVNMREKGFIWYSLTPPKAPATVFVNRMRLGGAYQPGDFGGTIYYSTLPDSLIVQAYAITNNGDSLSGVRVKFLNYTP
jgi:hypothetical protein